MHLTQVLSSVYLYNLIFVDLLHQQDAKFKINPSVWRKFSFNPPLKKIYNFDEQGYNNYLSNFF